MIGTKNRHVVIYEDWCHSVQFPSTQTYVLSLQFSSEQTLTIFIFLRSNIKLLCLNKTLFFLHADFTVPDKFPMS